VIIDGVFSTGEEWGTIYDITLYEHNNPTSERDMRIAAMHDDEDLYLLITVDETEYEAQILFLIFQTTAGPIITNYSIPHWSNGNDVKRIDEDNSTMDGYLSGHTFIGDSGNGGTTDFEGICYKRSGGYNYEMRIPLNSTDTNGGDIAVKDGDSINMFPTYMTSEPFSLIHTTNSEWKQIKLNFEEYSFWKIPSYSVPILLFSVIAVSIILIFKNREKINSGSK
jgi:hypothetical protein